MIDRWRVVWCFSKVKTCVKHSADPDCAASVLYALYAVQNLHKQTDEEKQQLRNNHIKWIHIVSAQQHTAELELEQFYESLKCTNKNVIARGG